MYNISIHILKNNPLLAPHANMIKKEVRKSLRVISMFFTISDVDIVVVHDPELIVSGCVSAQASLKHQITIALDVKHKDFKKQCSFELLRTLSHELCHIVRNQKVGVAKTLLDDFLEEGIADHIEVEVAGGTPPDYAVSLPESEIKKLIRRAKKELFSTEHSCSDWLYGSVKKKIPNRAGYNIGYYLIEQFLQKHPGASISTFLFKKTSYFASALKDIVGLPELHTP